MNPDDSADIAARKRALRRAVLDHRAGLNPAATAAASAAIADRVLELPEVVAASCCFCYVGMPGEVETRELINRLVDAGKTLAVPWQPGPAEMLACRFPGWSGMRPGAMQIPVPAEPQTLDRAVDVALTPGLAFSTAGGRLGYGAGYYDRWFSLNPATRRIALAFEWQIEEAIPLEPHDLPMEWIVTEARVISVSPGGAGVDDGGTSARGRA